MEALLKRHKFQDSGSISLAIGFFDGVHKGHRLLLEELVNQADFPYLLTFQDHPQEILYNTKVARLTSDKEKLALIQGYSSKIRIIVLPFSYVISQLSPEKFLSLIKQYIPFQHLILGYDSTIGHDKSGNVNRLSTLSTQMNFKIKSVPALSEYGVPISSRFIRELLSSGDLAKTKQLLERDYSISDRVTVGTGRGNSIGYPTANLISANRCLPPNGVYSVDIALEEEPYQKSPNLKGICYIGTAPTFKKRDKILEVHIFDFKEPVYEKNITVYLKKFIREEQCFSSVNDLLKRIKLDVEQAKNLLV